MKAMFQKYISGYLILIITLLIVRYLMEGIFASSYKSFIGMILLSFLYFPIVYVRDKNR